MKTFDNGILKFTCDERANCFEIKSKEVTFKTNESFPAFYIDQNNETRQFSELSANICDINEDGKIGFRFDYGSFETKIWTLNCSEEVHFELLPKAEFSSAKSICWPAPVYRDYCEKGYTVLPIMQGMLIPDKSTECKNIMEGLYGSRECTMAWWGQMNSTGGYMAVMDTPYDACMLYSHGENDSTVVRVKWLQQLGKLCNNRALTIRLFDKYADYSDMCRHYRKIEDENNHTVTLKEKEEVTASIRRLVGSTVIYPPFISYEIEPESTYYNAEEPEKNSGGVGFDGVVEFIDDFYKKGLKNAYVHIDGWGLGGYDNLCPRVLPPNEKAGGVDGLRRVIDVCKRHDYLLAYHDQYRDFYYKSPDFTLDDSVVQADGTCSSREDTIWYGGKETQLCAVQAIKYLRRNYEEMERTGLLPDGVYLDVFSASNLDECFSKEHPMTREDCAEYRKKCLNYIRSKGMIISSEEFMSMFADSLDLVHHSPYITAFFPFLNVKEFGINVPLVNLVYHDCLLIPWAMSKTAWGIPEGESGFLHGLLNGGLIAVATELDENGIELLELAGKLNREVAYSKMVSHKFLSDDCKVQKTEFSNGTVVMVDFKKDTYIINWADGNITEGTL